MKSKKKHKTLLGRKVLPLVISTQISASFASSILHGVNDMHRACHMDHVRVRRMVEQAKRELRKRNKEQNWMVNSIHANGTFDLVSDLGYEQNNVSRSDFRLLIRK